MNANALPGRCVFSPYASRSGWKTVVSHPPKGKDDSNASSSLLLCFWLLPLAAAWVHSLLSNLPDGILWHLSSAQQSLLWSRLSCNYWQIWAIGRWKNKLMQKPNRRSQLGPVLQSAFRINLG